jgi:hypothetical protein
VSTATGCEQKNDYSWNHFCNIQRNFPDGNGSNDYFDLRLKCVI